MIFQFCYIASIQIYLSSTQSLVLFFFLGGIIEVLATIQTQEDGKETEIKPFSLRSSKWTDDTMDFASNYGQITVLELVAEKRT